MRKKGARTYDQISAATWTLLAFFCKHTKLEYWTASNTTIRAEVPRREGERGEREREERKSVNVRLRTHFIKSIFKRPVLIDTVLLPDLKTPSSTFPQDQMDPVKNMRRKSCPLAFPKTPACCYPTLSISASATIYDLWVLLNGMSLSSSSSWK